MTACIQSGSREQTPQSRNHLMMALLICLLGFALLVHQLDEKSLWGDEAYTARVIRGDLEFAVRATAEETYPPIYYVCIWAWNTFMSGSEFALRFPSVVFGMLSIAMLYPLGTKVSGKRMGLMAMGLMAVSPFLVLYSRMARYYTLLLFFSLMCYWFFIKVSNRPSTGRAWVGYVISSALAMYTHYLAAFVLAAQALVALTGIKRRRQFALRLVGSQMMVALLFVPWLGVAVQQAVALGSRPDAFGSQKPTMWLLSMAYPFFAWSVGETIYPWNPPAFVGAILAAGLAIRGLQTLNRLSISDNHMIFKKSAQGGTAAGQSLTSDTRGQSLWAPQARDFITFLLLPLVLTAVTMRRFISGGAFLAVPSRTIFCAPLVYLLIARGTQTIISSRQRLALMMVLVLVLGLSLSNYYLGREFHNPNYVLQIEGLADVVVEQSDPGDVFVSDFMTAFDYYVSREDPQAGNFLAHDPETARDYIEEQKSRRVWLILLCRAVDTESLATVELVPWLLSEGYSLEFTSEYAPAHRAYAWVEQLVLRKPACEYKVAVYRYARFQ